MEPTQQPMQPPMGTPGSKHKKAYYIVGGLIVLAVAFYMINGNEADRGEDSSVPVAQTAQYTITYSDTGFSPARIEIPAGSKVRFANNANTNMWVASAVHPTHQALPGFDELKGEVKGSVYEYTFAKTGEWKFHDHLKPEMRGVVLVK